MRLKRFVFILFLLSGLMACDKYSGTNMLDSVLKTGEPYFAIKFNKLFAQRFSLPQNKAAKLSNNLQAIAVEINKVNDWYTCELHLYLDESLDIYKPFEGEYFSDKSWSEGVFINDFSEEDKVWNFDKVYKNLMKIRFDSTKQASYQFTTALSYNRVHSSFLPGLTIITLNTDCGMFERNRYPADIWIQKQNVGDYLVGNDGPGGVKQPENNHKFPIPMSLIDQIQPYIDIAEKHNVERL